MFKKSVLALAFAGLSSLANAATFDLITAPTDTFAIDGISKIYTFDAVVADPNAKLSFSLNLFNTVDGYSGPYIDVFSLLINGSQAFQGIYQGPGGQSGESSYDFGAGSSVAVSGGNVMVSGLSFNLKEGTNTFSFVYSPVGGSNGGGQSIGDESWSLGSASITAAVPEPETYAMFLAGLGLMGAAARRRARS